MRVRAEYESGVLSARPRRLEGLVATRRPPLAPALIVVGCDALLLAEFHQLGRIEVSGGLVSGWAKLLPGKGKNSQNPTPQDDGQMSTH